MKTLLLAMALAGNIAALGQTDPAPAGGVVMAPDNSNPERDAHGVKVISDAATVPPGYNGVGGAVGGPAEAATTTPERPRACSRTVTDNCLQTYERGRRRR